MRPPSLLRPRATGLLAAVVLGAGALTLGACDSATTGLDGATSASTSAVLSNVLSGELSLSASQQSRVASTLAAHDDRRTPGALWVVADSLSRVLTAGQRDSLIARTSGVEGGDPFRGLLGHPGGGYYGTGGFFGLDRRHGNAGADSVLNLTDAQKTQVKAIHKAYRDAVRALQTQRRGGTITDEAFLRGMLALHTTLQADLLAVLTDAQRTALAAYRTAREAAFATLRAQVTAVRDRVLGLTAAQSAAFDAILADGLAAREALVDQFGAGTITLEGFQTEVAALQAARATALQALLTPAQYLVVRIHDALAVRLGHRGKGHGPNGEFGRGPDDRGGRGEGEAGSGRGKGGKGRG